MNAVDEVKALNELLSGYQDELNITKSDRDAHYEELKKASGRLRLAHKIAHEKDEKIIELEEENKRLQEVHDNWWRIAKVHWLRYARTTMVVQSNLPDDMNKVSSYLLGWKDACNVCAEELQKEIDHEEGK